MINVQGSIFNEELKVKNTMIEEIKNSVKIMDIAKSFGLHRDKRGYLKSIYKTEKTPSLKIYEDTNTFYDFATHQGGDVITFYSAVKGITIKDAIKELLQTESGHGVKQDINKTRNYNIKGESTMNLELTGSEQESFNKKVNGIRSYDENNYKIRINQIKKDIMDERTRIQVGIFKDFKDFCNGVGSKGYEYLTGPKRGLSVESIATSGLFEIRDLKQTIEYLTDSYTSDMLKVSGLFNKDCKFVFWNHHIVIPYYEEGKITWLRGRTNPLFIKNEKISRYISPSNFATNLTAKRFYNIDALNGIDPTSQILVCEGEFDTIRSKQEGFISIGVPGINGIPDNLKEILKSFEIYLGFDSDVAGENAARTFTDQLGREVTYLYLKDHKDLTEYFNESE